MAHDHSHGQPTHGRAFAWGIALNTIYVIVRGDGRGADRLTRAYRRRAS